MLPQNVQIRDSIVAAARKGMAVAELEYLGVSLRAINTLEQQAKIIFLQQLIALSYADLQKVSHLGKGGVDEIIHALERFPELEAERMRWHKGSDKTEYYKRRINTKAILA